MRFILIPDIVIPTHLFLLKICEYQFTKSVCGMTFLASMPQVCDLWFLRSNPVSQVANLRHSMLSTRIPDIPGCRKTVELTKFLPLNPPHQGQHRFIIRFVEKSMAVSHSQFELFIAGDFGLINGLP